jgi:putative solute:sodium symporter small subunit
MTDKEQAGRRHWRATITLTVSLLIVWAVVGLGCGVLLADMLKPIRLGGYPLGFWFAQQGAIIVFVVLILIYAVGMSIIDRRYRREVGK